MSSNKSKFPYMNHILAMLFETHNPLNVKVITKKLGCPRCVAISHMKELETLGQVERYPPDNYVLAQYIREQLTESFAKSVS